MRSVKGVSDEDGRRRLLPMNCLAWNVGHLAWQEQRYFIYYGLGQSLLLPEIDREFAYGAPASTPSLKEMIAAWKMITKAADPWLDTVTSDLLEQNVISNGKPLARQYGNLLQRVMKRLTGPSRI